MNRLFVQYLAIYNNDNMPNSIQMQVSFAQILNKLFTHYKILPKLRNLANYGHTASHAQYVYLVSDAEKFPEVFNQPFTWMGRNDTICKSRFYRYRYYLPLSSVPKLLVHAFSRNESDAYFLNTTNLFSHVENNKNLTWWHSLYSAAIRIHNFLILCLLL